MKVDTGAREGAPPAGESLESLLQRDIDAWIEAKAAVARAKE